MKEGLQVLQIEPSSDFEFNKFQHHLKNLTKKNKGYSNGYIRLTVFRSDGGKYQALDNKANWLIDLVPLQQGQFELNTKGLKVGLYDQIPVSCNILSPFKTLSALPYVLASNFARTQGWDDCFLLSEDGSLCEATSSNIFLVKGGKITGVAIESGAIQGVMQNVIRDICLGKGIPFEFKRPGEKQALDADEIFLTNAVQGIRWVGTFGGKEFHHDLSTFLLELLNEEVSRKAR